MLIYIGTDHRGFNLKESLKKYLADLGYSIEDVGNEKYDESDDYPIFAKQVAEKVAKNLQNSKGVVICGSGAGADIVANKIQGIRSVLAISVEQAEATRSDDDTNVLALAADYTSEEDAKRILSSWLKMPFSGEEKHKKRLREIEMIELGN
ncbi:MAG: RpiB/LacA/LacB family sugar-phosphate isomerase [Candidatus Pacebacteria bacterium]|nr:RpiB/LacA/LacB family sugar-phosphate isomerase [Candidatus Paceibacterota bacterium]